ncbi:hypothetical protein MACK_000500 [Theileria orientalis]|uniref:Uncharacterized protein n=1 Tax=Theileria orientalis TaxID=68886 RepID=A0A976QU12_THEOR|nr:hypothetical protein MACK_000500 [Theileria orientalis]
MYYSEFSEASRSTAETRNELSNLEKVENIVKNVDILYSLIKNDIFIYDDRVQRALEELRIKKNEVGDYETLLKMVEIFYRTGDSESMINTLSYFLKDVPYMPNHILVELTRYFNKAHRNSSLTRALQSQLYLNTCSNSSGDVCIENVLYCIDVIKDNSIVDRVLKAVDFSQCNEYDKLFTTLKLYHILLSRGGDKIEGFMVSAMRQFRNLLNNRTTISNTIGIASNRAVNSNSASDINIGSNSNSNSNSNSSSSNMNSASDDDEDTTACSGGNESTLLCYADKHVVNCFRMLIKIKNYETLDYGSISNIISSGYSYNATNLVLLLRDAYYCSYALDASMLASIYRSIFDNIAQISKDDVVLVFKFLNKYQPQLTNSQLDLLNVQAMLHMSEYRARDLLSIVNYYSSIPTSADTHNLMEKLYSHLVDITDSSIGTSIGISSIGNGVSDGNVSVSQHEDTNIHIYTLSKFMIYFNSAQSGSVVRKTVNNLMMNKLKRYIRTIAYNHIDLSDKTVAYCLYTFYKVKHDPVKLIQKLMPSLDRRLDNSVDLVQALLFFTRNRYGSFYPVLVRKVERKMANNEYNCSQLVIISMCLSNYKRIFTSQLFTVINTRLEEMSISQVCTVFNSYAKSGLRSESMISTLNQRVLRDLGSISSKEAMNLLLPIKKGYIRSERVVEYIKTLDLDTYEKFYAFGQVPMDGKLTDNQVVKCLLCLSEKERGTETDRFARELYSRVVKIVPSLSDNTIRSILKAIQAYGYSKPKVKRILTNRLMRHNRGKEIIKKTSVSRTSSTSKDKHKNTTNQGSNLLTFFRHISLGPPHLPLQNE